MTVSLPHEAQARSQAGEGRRAAGRAGQASRWQVGPGADYLKSSAARSCWSCWSRKEFAVEARAPVTDVVEVAVPVCGHAGGNQARVVPGEVPKPRAAGGARQGWAAHRRQGKAHLPGT